MNELSRKYGRDRDICYWYYLFKDYEELDIKPKYFREEYDIPERRFWNQIRVYIVPHKCPSIQKKYFEYYREFSSSDKTIRDFASEKKVRMSTFDMWRRHFMTQERIEQLINEGKLIKPKSLKYDGTQ